MSRSSIRRTVTIAGLAGCLFGLCLGANCGGEPPLNPVPAPGNLPPRIYLTSITTPGGGNLAQQGDPVTITFAGEDAEDVCTVRVFASLSQNPPPSAQLPILSGYSIGPGAGTGAVIWDTTSVVPGTYYIFAEIDDHTYNSNDGMGNPPVRVTAADPIIIAPIGTAPENGAPTVQVDMPNSDAGVSDKSILTIRFSVKDPNSDTDTLNITYYLDRDRDATNDSTDPPIELGTYSIAAGTLPPDTLGWVTFHATINLDEIPPRRDVDEGDRPLPYFVRVRADDGHGNVVDGYAVGGVRVLAAASDVVDTHLVGGLIAGATWQGFDGFPDDPLRGGRVGSSFAPLGDLDGDGLDDFVIAAQTASPFNNWNAGGAYLVYGRQRDINPDQPNFPYAQGRYAGLINVNTIGSMVPFPPNDPRHETVFNIRGSVIPNAVYYGFSKPFGIESVVALPDITGDGRPEILVGAPYEDTVVDQIDDDPCDTCTYPQGETSIPCFNTGISKSYNGQLQVGNLNAGQWFPYDPTLPPGGTPAPDVDLQIQAGERPYIAYSLVVRMTGTRTDATPDQPFGIVLQLEDQNGPQITVLATPDAQGQFGQNVPVTGTFLPTNPVFPTSIDEGIPGSVYDGVFTLFLQPGAAVSMNQAEVVFQAQVATAAAESGKIKVTYRDGFPNPFSTDGSIDAGINPLGLADFTPVCPPMNRTWNPPPYPGNGFGNQDGQFCSVAQSLMIGCNFAGTNDDLFGPYGGGPYQSGLVFVLGSDDLYIPLDVNGIWTGQGQRLAEIDQFGQPRFPKPYLRGGRFRGAWYQRDLIYDPRSFFGYTMDVMPDIDSRGLTSEILFSAPATGPWSWTTANLSAPPPDGVVGTYDAGGPGASISFQLDTVFNQVTAASLVISGSATNVARLVFGFDDGSGHPDPATSRTALLWKGASQPNQTGGDPTLQVSDLFNSTVQFSDWALELPQSVRFAPEFHQGFGRIAIEVVPDCVVDGSSVTITSAQLLVEGLLRENGAVIVMNTYDYTSTLGCADQEAEQVRPISWPCSACASQYFRTWVFYALDIISYLDGENPDDAFGFAHNAGDLNLDGVADIACGAPGNDNDPVNPDINCGVEPNPLTNNGKAYIIYGTPAMGSGKPCEFERLEIRGTHNEDQFGRVQGSAGDMNGDGNSDVFVAAEGYDAMGSLGNVPNVGVDAGFVGVVFGTTLLTGEIAIAAEQIGTGNFPGCKFIGAMPGARLGGGSQVYNTWAFASQKGQHGVAKIGDFNLDNIDDLLITAPGQTWPGARIKFNGPVADGETVTINGTIFEFDLNGTIGAGHQRVALTSPSADAAESALLGAMEMVTAEQLGVASIVSKKNFPAPLPDIPTISFLARKWNVFHASTTASNVVVETFNRQGAAYVIFGDRTLLQNKVFLLPDDINRRNAAGNRVLKGIVFVSAYETNQPYDPSKPDEAPIEAVSAAGDIDGDGYVDILLGAPQADFINILAPTERRRAAGEAYLIYGNDFGMNRSSHP